jgi:hypothetical protein
MKMAIFWDAAIALIMEAVSSSEMSVSIYDTTRRNIPEDSHLHIILLFLSPHVFYSWFNHDYL